MTASITYTAMQPNLTTSGEALTLTSAGASGDIVPISSTMRTVIVIANSSGSPSTVTFTSAADEWGNSGAGIDKVITVPGTTTVICGPFLPYRFGTSCIVNYGTAANISMGVINVPNANL